MKVVMACLLSSRGAMGDNYRQLSLDLSRAGIDVSAIVPGPYPVSDFSHCRDVLPLDMPKTRPLTYVDPGRLIRVKRFLQRQKADVLFFYGPHPVNLIIARMGSRSSRLVYWLHDPIQHSDGNSLYARIYHYHDQWLLKRSDGIVVAYEEARALLLQKGIPPQRIHKAYLGFLENFTIEHSPSVHYDFIFFGRLEHYKGLDVLAKALRHLQARGQTLRGIVAGPGNVRSVAPALEELARQGHIQLHERYVPDGELSALIASARVTVLPYRDATGTQTVQIAAYHKRPVLATRVGCFPEYVVDGKTGVLVEPENAAALADAMTTLKENPERWDALGQAAHRLWFHGEYSNLNQAAKLGAFFEHSPARSREAN